MYCFNHLERQSLLMSKTILVSIIIIFIMQLITGYSMADERGNEFVPPEVNDVHISPIGIIMRPLGKIILMRKDSEYCAIKFTKSWLENTSEGFLMFVASGSDKYAIYESHYQGDKTGDFSKNNLQIVNEKLAFTKPRGIGRLSFSFGNQEIKCGAVKLWWGGGGSVHFFSRGQREGDYGIELAPTKWTEISQVNVFDPRLKWYRYDPKRPRVDIPIDKLWEDKNDAK